MMLTTTIIGCGKVGKTLGLLLQRERAARITNVCNTTLESSEAAVRFIGQGNACASLDDIVHTDLYFITTRDDQIETVCRQLAEKKLFRVGAMVMHCSGTLTSDVLQAAYDRGCFVASVAPLKSFADPRSCIDNFAGTYCVYEGNKETRQTIRFLIDAIGGILLPIEKPQKILCHIASVFANNFLLALSRIAGECYQHAGVPAPIGKKITQQLMRDALNNLEKLSFAHEKALTGPIARGDVNTIAKHLAALAEKPELLALYKMLSAQTIELAQHDEKVRENLEKLFI